mgnify:CR=1 FL=1
MIAKNTKNQFPGIISIFKKIFQIILYIPIQIIFIPFAIIGIIIALYKELGKSKKLGVSFSAIKALQYRWMMHYFNTRINKYFLFSEVTKDDLKRRMKLPIIFTSTQELKGRAEKIMTGARGIQSTIDDTSDTIQRFL